MEIKDRVIQYVENDQTSEDGIYIMIDEYGIEKGKIYHRHSKINEKCYDRFAKAPDEEMLLDEFLTVNGLDREWEEYVLPSPVEGNNLENSSRLFDGIDLGTLHHQTTEWSVEARNEIYQKLYNKLVESEALITNPLIMDVFNEAIREDSEMAQWESVFPFFQ